MTRVLELPHSEHIGSAYAIKPVRDRRCCFVIAACHKDMQSHVRDAGRGISSLFRQVLSLFYAPTLKPLAIT